LVVLLPVAVHRLGSEDWSLLSYAAWGTRLYSLTLFLLCGCNLYMYWLCRSL